MLVVSNEAGGAHFTTATGCTGNMVRAAFGVGGNSAITVFYEAIGSSGSTTNCTLTASGATVTNAIITAATFENVLQTEGLDDQTGATLALYNAVSGGANAATPGSIDLTGTPATLEGGLVVYGINVNGTIQIATPSGFTEEVDFVGGSNVTSGGERTSTTESNSVVLNVATETSTANRWSAVEIALNPTSGGSGATFTLAQDTKLTGLARGTIQRIRFEISNEGGASSGPVMYQLEVAETDPCNTGTYSAVPTDTSGHWQVALTGNLNRA